MAVSSTNGAAQQAPRAETRQASKNEPKRPQDNTAARRTPKETTAAVKHTFGSVPQDGDTGQPVATPKPNANLRTNNTAPNPAPEAAMLPVDPKVQAILDAKLPDGKTVKEKIDADAPGYILKAAQDHYNAQKDKGEAFDAISIWYQNNSARAILENGIPDAKITAANAREIFDIDKISKNIDKATSDPVFGQWLTEQQANSIETTAVTNPDIAKLIQPYLLEGENRVNALRRMQSDYMSGQDFADVVAKANTPEEGKKLVIDGMKTLSSLGLGEKEMLGVSNTLAENIRGKYASDAPKPVIDPSTNKPVQTEDEYNLATLPDGIYIALDKNGKPIADKGSPYVYWQDGTAKTDAGGRYIQYDARSGAIFAVYDGTHYMVGPDGKGRYDAQGRPLAIDSGAPVALDKDGKAVADKTRNKLVFDPVTGKAVTDPKSGNAVVIDPSTSGIVQTDAKGKIVAGKNGDPYAVDQKTGKFVQDAQGRYVQVSKDNAVPGIVPGYVVDANNNKLVVNPVNGKPMVDPALGKTVILDPKTNSPQLVPLDTKGAPKLSQDGMNIIYDEFGHTVVPNAGKGPNWLVDASGNYTQNDNGNYIGVGRNGLAAPVDADGFVRNVGGMVPLWDTKTGAPMTTKDGSKVVTDDDGNLLISNASGQTIVEEKTGLPYLLDTSKMAVATNPATGRSILLDKSGLPIEYNADDGYKYLINPKTLNTVKTSDGKPVVTSSEGLPYAINADGTVITNPATGNAIVHGFDGQPAKELNSGYGIEITSGGTAHVIDPKTNTPMAERDPKTGGYQLFDPDGNDTVNPDTGNKIQLVPDSGLKVEIDTRTGKPVADAKGNPLISGKDNRPLKTPGGNAVVGDLKTGLPVSADANGLLVLDPASKLPIVINTDTGAPLADPQTNVPVVADPELRNPVQVDVNGKIVTDPVTSMPVAINTKTGAQIKGPNGESAVNDPRTGLPVYYDQQSKLLTVVDSDTNQIVTDPTTGAKTIVDTGSGLTFEVLPDASGNHIIVDENGLPVKDDKGRQPYFDKATGRAVIVNASGEVVDVKTGKAPVTDNPKELVYTTPFLLMGPPAIATMIYGGEYAGVGDPDNWPQKGNSTSGSPVPPDRPWEAPGYTMTPEERAAFVKQWQTDYPLPHEAAYEGYLQEVQAIKKLYPALQGIPDEELAAVRGYTSAPWWQPANEAMRLDDPELLRKYDPYIKAVKSGLTRLSEAGFSYAGPSVRFMKLSPADFERLFGGSGPYTNQQFMSTAMDLKALKKSPFIGYNTKLKVNHLTGVDIQILSQFPHQQEIVGQPPGQYSLTNVKRWGTKGGIGTLFQPRNVNKATLTEIPRALGLPGGNTDFGLPSTSGAAGKWSSLGKALGMAGIAADAIFGGIQLVTGGMQIADGVKNKDAFDIASGAVNIGSGVLALASTVAAVTGGAAAAAAIPLAGVAAFAGMIALIVDILKHKDDHKKFASALGDMFGPFDIFKDGWREKAELAYYNNHGEPDPAPIAHGYLP